MQNSSAYVCELFAITELVQKMATIPTWVKVLYLHRPTKLETPVIVGSPNPRTIKMGNKTHRV